MIYQNWLDFFKYILALSLFLVELLYLSLYLSFRSIKPLGPRFFLYFT